MVRMIHACFVSEYNTVVIAEHIQQEQFMVFVGVTGIGWGRMYFWYVTFVGCLFLKTAIFPCFLTRKVENVCQRACHNGL